MNTSTAPLWHRYRRTLREGWMAASRTIGLVVSSILLTALWVVVFGAYALALRCINVFRAHRKHPESFWHDVSTESDYRHQF